MPGSTATLQRPQAAEPQIQQIPLQTNWLDTCEHPLAAPAQICPWPPDAALALLRWGLSCCFLDSSSWPLNNVHFKPQWRLWQDISADLDTSFISGIIRTFLGARNPILQLVISQRFSLHHHMTKTCLSPGPDRNLPARHQAKESSGNFPQMSEMSWHLKFDWRLSERKHSSKIYPQSFHLRKLYSAALI